jgi:hypothetical protein
VAETNAKDELRRKLGLRPRGPASADAAAPRERKKPAAPPPRAAAAVAPWEPDESGADPARKPVGKLPPQGQVLLRNYYHQRPEVDLPPHVLALEGTFGQYFGDGQDGREIVLGFRPAFVLFTCPLYPGAGPQWVKAKGAKRDAFAQGELVDPGLAEQPDVTDRGFRASGSVNKLGEMAVYIAWKAPPEEKLAPVEAAAPEETTPRPGESPRSASVREARERRARDLEARKARDRERRAR